MDKAKAIQAIERHINASCSLGLKDDEAIFTDILNFIKSSKSSENANISVYPDRQKRNKYGEADFQAIASDEIADISAYDIDARVVANKDNALNFWCLLNDEERCGFTIFELNVILYLISRRYNKYQKKDKKRIISIINAVAKNKRMADSYKNIVV
ncbi:MAG: hypothetical protein LBL83_02665 [Clostridiales bacterium]|nr:hypothetical protein [Clostridiales bacterium]